MSGSRVGIHPQDFPESATLRVRETPCGCEWKLNGSTWGCRSASLPNRFGKSWNVAECGSDLCGCGRKRRA